MPKKLFDQELYGKISINDLILFGVFSAKNNKERCGFEKLVKECFFLFPKSFSLLGYSEWPDSRKLDRPLRTLRKRKLISGSPKTSFSLTNNGRKRAEEIAKIFRQRKLQL